MTCYSVDGKELSVLNMVVMNSKSVKFLMLHCVYYFKCHDQMFLLRHQINSLQCC
jgi:hypothetical protein